MNVPSQTRCAPDKSSKNQIAVLFLLREDFTNSDQYWSSAGGHFTLLQLPPLTPLPCVIITTFQNINFAYISDSQPVASSPLELPMQPDSKFSSPILLCV